MIQLQINPTVISLPRDVEPMVSNALTRKAMLKRALQRIKIHSTTQDSFFLPIHESTLDRMTVKYSEQAVFNPRREIQYWFAYNSGAFLEPGYAPLYYFQEQKNRPSPNKSAVAAIGEGVAGFIAQRKFNCSKLARPNHDYPDIVMESSQGQRQTFLVEAKATISGITQSKFDEYLLRFVSNTATAERLDVRPVRGLFVTTKIETEFEYTCNYTEIEITQ